MRGSNFAVQPDTKIPVTGIPDPVDIFEIFTQYSYNLKGKQVETFFSSDLWL